MVAGPSFLRERATWGLSDPRSRKQRQNGCAWSEGFSLRFGLEPPLGGWNTAQTPYSRSISQMGLRGCPRRSSPAGTDSYFPSGLAQVGWR